MSDSERTEKTEQTDDGRRSSNTSTAIDRRDYLRYAGAAASAPIIAGPAAGATEGDDGEPDGSASDIPMPTDLQTEYERDPMNVRSTEAPRLSWRFPPERRGFNQAAYRIQVSSSTDSLADGDLVWDSGWTDSVQSTAVEYDGEELEPDTTYHWRVRIQGADGTAGDWSETGTFTTALPDADEHWDGEWIGNVPEDDGPMAWTNYTLEATLQIEEAATGPLVRAQDAGTFYLWQIVLESSPDNDTDSHLLRPHRFEDGDWTILEDGSPTTAGVPIDDAIDDPDGDQHVEIAVSDDEITTWINGERVDSRTDSILERGTIGFRQFGNEHVSIDEITVTGPDGNILYADDFETSASEGFEDGEIDDGWLELDGTGVTLYDVDRPSTSPLLRKEVGLTGDVESARAHVVTLGFGEFYVNGERVGDEQLNPAKTEYEERVLYTTYDVEDLLEAGENAIGLWLGRGWFAFDEAIGTWAGTDWSAPRALLQLNVTYADGRTESVVTDDSWRLDDSPIVANNVYDGETYDARMEQSGWAEPDFDDANWRLPAALDPPAEDMALSPQRLPPTRVTKTLEPETITERDDGYLIDFGQNHTGWSEITMRGAEEGDEISILHVESLLTADGDLTHDVETGEPNTIDLREADATDVYVAKGDDEETYAPRFTYHGFRYALVQGYPGELTADDVRSHVVHTGYDRTGSFRCSNEELNRVQENAVWGLRSNAQGYPMDCPQRDERLGWTGDVHQNVNADFFNFGNAARFHEKWIRDHDDNQRSEGYVTDTIPQVAAVVGGPADPNWGKTRVIIPWRTYLQTGDEHVLEASYNGMRAYVDYWHEQADEHVLGAEHLSYGDWLAFEGERTDPALYNTYAHYQTTDLFARAAAALGRDEDATTYRERADAIAEAFNDAFLGRAAEHFDGGMIRDGSLVVDGGGVVLHDDTEDADEWTDYTFEAEFTLEQDAAGFVFRAQDADNFYMWQVNTVNAPQPVLRPHVRENGGWSVLEEIPIDDVFDGEGATHRIEIEVQGDEIVTAIDGTEVDRRTDGTHAAGTVGFRQNGVERVRVHAVDVTDADGETLLADDFMGGGDLAYGSGTQTTYALPLFAGIAPNEREVELAETLAEKVRTEDGGKIQTGFIGTRPLIYALVDHGYEELAYNVVSQPEQPGWVYMVRQGATTMWERWDSDEMVASGMNSFNHRPWTLISEWFYRTLAGIDVGEPGYEHIEIVPMVVDDLEWAEAETETVRGTVASRWERVETAGAARNRDGLTLAVTIPGNATATVEIPTLGGEKVRIREDGKAIWNNGNRVRPKHPGIKDMSREDGKIVAEVGAGEYAFELEPIGQ